MIDFADGEIDYMLYMGLFRLKIFSVVPNKILKNAYIVIELLN